MKATPAFASAFVITFCAVFAGCIDDRDEPAEGLLGALCFSTNPADRSGNCTEGIRPRCESDAEEGECGLGPPGSLCGDNRPRCVECGGDDPDPLCPPPPPPEEGEACDVEVLCESGLVCVEAVAEACDVEVLCESGLVCVEAVALEGGTCREVPEACAADLCGCPGDDLAPLCDGARPNDCEGSFIACDGVYADP